MNQARRSGARLSIVLYRGSSIKPRNAAHTRCSVRAIVLALPRRSGQSGRIVNRSARPWSALLPRREIRPRSLYPVIAVALILSALWWGARRRWSGEPYCADPSDLETCGDPFVAGLLVYVLWSVTVVSTLVVSVLGRQFRPSNRGLQFSWACAIGVAVLLANRQNMAWAVVASVAALLALVWTDSTKVAAT